MSLQTSKDIALDFIRNSYVCINGIKQYDSAVFINISVFDEGKEIDILPSYTIEARFETPDGRHIMLTTDSFGYYARTKKEEIEGAIIYHDNDDPVNVEIRKYIPDIKEGERVIYVQTSTFFNIHGNIITLNIPQAVFLKPGRVKGEIRLIDGEMQLVTMDLDINVIGSVFDASTVADDLDYDEVNAIMASIRNYASSASTSAKNASTSEVNAKTSETNAKNSETKAKTSETNAKSSENNALASATTATTKADEAKASAAAAKQSEDNIKGYDEKCEDYALQAQSYANGTAIKDGKDYREGQKTDNAKYWYEQAKGVSTSLSGVLKPMGTFTFEELPVIEPDISGYMYNISNEFTSDSRFKDGGGLHYGIGSNVYCTADGFWDVLASATAGGGIMVSDTEPEQNENSIWLQPYE